LESIFERRASASSELLECCLRGENWSTVLLDRAIEEDDGRALLSIVVERLGDLFESRLVKTYECLYTEAIVRVAPELRPRLRIGSSNAKAPATTDRVYVLSRVTLGADVAVTSVLLDAAKRRYPNADIVFVGPRKSYEMFEADPRIRHLDAPYARAGSLRERLQASGLWFEDGIVIDPDSRLTQLGLISVCDPSRYFFFPSRSIEGTGRLPELANQWARSVFAVDAKPYIAPRVASTEDAADVTVSLGVGENPAKRLGDDFERELVDSLRGCSVLIDKGGSAEERARVERAVLPGMRTHDGSFAAFASEIARSKLYIGYDSAGGHVASACGVPVISIFAGAVGGRFFERWKPIGTVIRGEDPYVRTHLSRAIAEARKTI
jgi:hypothetical protein